MRKIIQIAVAGVKNTAETQCNYVTTALCDDGAVFEMRNNSAHWDRLPDIPQDSEPAKETHES